MPLLWEHKKELSITIDACQTRADQEFGDEAVPKTLQGGRVVAL